MEHFRKQNCIRSGHFSIREINWRKLRGLRSAVWQLLRVNDLKTGALVGVDKYYEDKKGFFGQHRWVEYTTEINGKNTFEVDGRMVPPEWHHWRHCITEGPPTTHPPAARKFICENHKFNLSGTPGQYIPFSTTHKKIQEWIPPTTAN
ncbi:LOW QUALITY PROTEIN: NADH dehydrogenase [ubiquinone] 1 alpha subcomplex subunit 12 [Macrochelys suwanniensis]